MDSANNDTELPLLTFNSLYNLLREEKKNKTLQKLPNLFYSALKNYMEEKNEIIKKLQKEKNLEKLKKEKMILKNSKKIAKDILNIRCFKISNIAIQNELFGKETLSEINVLESEEEFTINIKKNTSKLYKNIN